MEISELKKQVNIIEVAGKLGIELNKFNKALCPFHADKNPSLQFSMEKQIATCFSGKCNLGTVDVIGLVERKLNVNTHEALKYLSPQVSSSGVGVGSPQANNSNEIKNSSVDLLQKLEITSRSSFKLSKPAQAYADLRGLIGCGSSPLHFLGVTFYQAWNEVQRDEAEQLGLIKKFKGSTYESAFKNRLIFFIRNQSGAPTGIYGRAIDVHNSVPHLYLKGNQKGLYPNYPKQSTKKLILTESIVDAASLEQLKVEGSKLNEYEVLALYGVNGYTKAHTEAVSQLKELEEIILFFDGDEAGREGINKISDEIKKSFPRVLISQVPTPEGEDINSLLVGHAKAEELFLHLLESRAVSHSGQPEQDRQIQQSISTASITPVNARSVEKNKMPAVAHGLNYQNPNNIYYSTANAIYAVKGGISRVLDNMKVTLSVEHGNRKSRIKIDLYEDKQVFKAAREISEKLGVEVSVIEMELGQLTDELENYREGLSKSESKNESPSGSDLSLAEKEQALKLLKSKNLVEEINNLIGKSGIVGECESRLTIFIIACSYLTQKPLHALIQGSSGSGKTHLMNKILDLLPKQNVIRITRVTESSFYNYEETFFKNKILGMEDLDGLEEKALFAFRELQSKGEISSSTTGKNEETGEIHAYMKTVRGPIASLSCTTKGEIYEDNMSRSFLIAVNESAAQTAKILQYQQQKAAGLINDHEEKQAARQIQNALSLLKSYKVINPFATKLQLPQAAQKIRRLHELFQFFVQTITIINQYQRSVAPTGELISTKEDLQSAVEIMFDSIMLKVDEVDGSLRDFYEKLKKYIKQKSKSPSGSDFSAREIRHELLISKTQLHRYLNELQELEYIRKSSTGIRNTFNYKIMYWDNIEKLREEIKGELNYQLEQLQ